MKILEDTFKELNRNGLVESHSEFSTKWLNKSSRYMSMIRATQREPSVDALAKLAANLKFHTDVCRKSDFGKLRAKVDWLYPLTQKVWNEFYKKALS